MRLKVGDVILDQFKNTVIAQNYETNNFGDISTRNGGFSNDFTLPLTANNDQALGFPSDINTTSRNPYKKVEAQLIDAGAVISIGYLRYKIVQNKTIQCAFFTDNTEWFNLIKDKNLVDLDLSDYDHEWKAFDITASFGNTSGYIYPVIDYGYYKNQDIDSGSGDTEVFEYTMFPAMFVSSLIEQIFKDIGWNVSGELLSDERFQRMIQPFSAEEFSKDQELIDGGINDFIESGTPDLTVDLQSEDILFGGVSPVNVDHNDNYILRLNIAWDYTRSNPTGTLDVGLSIAVPNPLGGFLVINKEVSNVQDISSFNYVWDISTQIEAAIDQNYIRLITTDNLAPSININFGGGELGTLEVTSGNFELVPYVNYLAGDTIKMANTMPDISQADFLKYIFFSFGVVPQPNNYSKTISLDFFRTIEDNIPNAVDWSNKLDVSKNISTDFTQLLNSYSRVSLVKYEEDDNDADLSSYRAETKKGFGQGQLDIDNEHLDPEKDIYTAPYTPMININSFSNSVNIPQIKWFEYNDDDMIFEKEVSPSPKIALISDEIEWSKLNFNLATNYQVNSSIGGVNYALPTVPFCWFVKTQYIPEVDAYNLSLAYDQVSFPNAIGTTLIDEYISDYEVVLNNMKYVKARFRLNEVDINNLDFLVPVYIDRFKAYFYINKIKNYQGSTKTTEVELIKIGGNG